VLDWEFVEICEWGDVPEVVYIYTETNTIPFTLAIYTDLDWLQYNPA